MILLAVARKKPGAWRLVFVDADMALRQLEDA